MTDLELTVLAMLSETERYGYEIDKLSRTRTAGFSRKMARSSVYAVLGRLLRRGFVTVREVAGGSKPPRRLYSLTYNGRQELESSLESALMPPDAILGNLRLFLTVWALIPHDRRQELLNTYNSHLTRKKKDLARLAAGEINSINAANFERDLAIANAESEWLSQFCRKNGVRFDLSGG